MWSEIYQVSIVFRFLFPLVLTSPPLRLPVPSSASPTRSQHKATSAPSPAASTSSFSSSPPLPLLFRVLLLTLRKPPLRFAGAAAIDYGPAGTDDGNRFKVRIPSDSPVVKQC